jgi:hypothetical protein
MAFLHDIGVDFFYFLAHFSYFEKKYKEAYKIVLLSACVSLPIILIQLIDKHIPVATNTHATRTATEELLAVLFSMWSVSYQILRR